MISNKYSNCYNKQLKSLHLFGCEEIRYKNVIIVINQKFDETGPKSVKSPKFAFYGINHCIITLIIQSKSNTKLEISKTGTHVVANSYVQFNEFTVIESHLSFCFLNFV